MVIPVALALMAGGAYRKVQQDKQDAADRAEDREALRKDRAWTDGERQRITRSRARMAEAAAPVAPVDGTVYQPEVDDDGNAMPANPTAGTLKVGDQRFTDAGAAAAAATAANTPAARTARMSAALEQEGDYVGAQQLRAGARQEEASSLALQQAKDAEARQAALREMGSLLIENGWKGVPAVYDRYNDGRKVQVEEDGEGGATVITTDESGTEVGRRQFKSLPELFASVAGRFDPTKWLEREDKNAETARVQGNADRDYALRAADSKARRDHDARMLALRGREVSIAGQKAAAEAAPAQVTLKDMREFEDDVLKRLGPEFDPKNALEESERSRITAARNDMATRASGIFRVNAERGLPVTAEVALNAIRLASNRANVREQPANDGMVYPVVVINGAPVIVGPGKAPAPAAPAARPAAAAPPTAAPAAPASAAAAPAAAPGATTAMPFQEFLAKNITTPRGKQLIAQRIRQDLPRLQAQIDGDTRVMAMPMVSGAVKARLKQRIDAAALEAQLMQAFIDGNPGV